MKERNRVCFCWHYLFGNSVRRIGKNYLTYEITKVTLAMESTTMREAFEEIERLSQNEETRRLADFREQEIISHCSEC